MRRHLLFAALFALCASSAHAATSPGSLDDTFGNHGHTLTDASAQNRYDERACSVLIQSDGKRVVVVDRYPYLQLIRFNADGTYDAGFGEGGFSQAVRLSRFGGPNSNAAIQADGKIVVTGETPWNSSTLTDFGIARWNTNGTLDASFGDQGVVTLDYGYWDEGQMVRIQPDGKLVVCGEVDINNVSFIGLARLNTDGSLDATFGVGGKYVNVPDFSPTDMDLTPDGKIMILGDNFSDDFVLARFNGNGIIDTGFGVQGYDVYTLMLGTHHAFVRCMGIQADGKLLIGGSISNGVNGDMMVARYSADGHLDGTFSGDGIQTTHIGGSEDVNEIAVQPDGRIVAVGDVYYGGGQPTRFALARYMTNGDLDGGFGVQGTQITTFTGYDGASANAVALHADGDLTVAGSAYRNYTGDVAVATYDVQGAADQDGYPVQKIAAFYADGGLTYFYASAVQSDGKLVAAGYAWNGVDYDMVVTRFNLDGTPDASFGSGGSQKVDFSAVQEGSGDETARAIAIQSDGKIVVTGSFFGFTVGGALPVARLTSTGSLDASFGSGGVALFDLPGIFEEGNAMVVQPDGKIVIAGSTLSYDFDFMLCRLNTNGTLDAGFGTGGSLTTDYGYQDIAFGLVLQPDGKLVATGNTSDKDSFLGFDFNTVRYNSNGSVDAGFATGGRARTDFDGSFDFAQAIALQSNGGLLVAGGVSVGTSDQFGIARYGSTGAPDAGFGSGGTRTVGLLGDDAAMAVAVQSDGRILQAGFAGSGGGLTDPVDIGLTRCTDTGQIDTQFGTGGKVIADFGGQELGFGMNLYKRRIYVAGVKKVFRPFTLTDKYFGLAATFLTGPPTADELSQDLISKILGMIGLASGSKQALITKLESALACLAARDTSCACGSLRAFVNEVNAQDGKKLTRTQAAQLLADAVAIMTTLNCPKMKYAGDDGEGGESSPAEVPASFALGRVSPNPFSGAARIAYQLPVASRVSLRIYNVLGQLVATVVDGDEDAGWKSVRWDASRVPAGVYFCRLQAGTFVSDRKMLLVR